MGWDPSLIKIRGGLFILHFFEYISAMTRIIGIDYGAKRTGISATDELQIAVFPFKTVPTIELLDTLKKYLTEENVSKIVFGLPKHSDGTPTFLVAEIKNKANTIKQLFPEIIIDYQDESFSSADALDIMIQSGMKKKKRKDKANVDLISAVIILQRYLKHIP